MKLSEIRTKIDKIDDETAKLFERRLELVAEIANIKAAQGVPILNVTREDEIINRLTINKDEDLSAYIKMLYKSIFNISREYQRKLMQK
ncbi:MAG: chorismate mutase [Hydrogenoanaerobacterium sp.]